MDQWIVCRPGYRICGQSNHVGLESDDERGEDMSTSVELQGSRTVVKAVKWVSIAVLLAAAGLWSHLTAYEVAVRFIVAAGAIVAMLHAFHARNYAFAALFGALALLSATILPGDLSKYRNFELGTDLSTVARQVGASPSQAKVIHRRPALIQELDWRPQPLGPPSQAEAAKEVVFSFYQGELFQIAINYDRYETEGLTPDDLVEAISATYGLAARPAAPAKAAPGRYGDQEEVLARWQDSQHCFDLTRPSYGPRFRLIGFLKTLRALAQAAITEAKRLDQEAPQRDSGRIASENEGERAKLEQSRLVNKPKFRP